MLFSFETLRTYMNSRHCVSLRNGRLFGYNFDDESILIVFGHISACDKFAVLGDIERTRYYRTIVINTRKTPTHQILFICSFFPLLPLPLLRPYSILFFHFFSSSSALFTFVSRSVSLYLSFLFFFI